MQSGATLAVNRRQPRFRRNVCAAQSSFFLGLEAGDFFFCAKPHSPGAGVRAPDGARCPDFAGGLPAGVPAELRLPEGGGGVAAGAADPTVQSHATPAGVWPPGRPLGGTTPFPGPPLADGWAFVGFHFMGRPLVLSR